MICYNASDDQTNSLDYLFKYVHPLCISVIRGFNNTWRIQTDTCHSLIHIRSQDQAHKRPHYLTIL